MNNARFNNSGLESGEKDMEKTEKTGKQTMSNWTVQFLQAINTTTKEIGMDKNSLRLTEI